MWEAYKLSVLWATIIAGIAWACALIYPQWISKAFTNDSELIAQTANGIRLYFLVFPVIGFQLVTSHFFLSIGKAKISIMLSLFRQVIVLLPFLFILPPLWKVDGVWLSEPFASSISMLLALWIMYQWYAKQEWKRIKV
jgi:Na+-driven multidrug efflux pump